ncbi:hypothetical protein WA026_017212 [Henosepilachna vigintioctopunctata]|uniref:Elongation of very long chain fatty acids protein n=1 Tax=Henosepilachna vigintioctopunctata TaxID=420089 RepID=A0AAW1UG64_9CUCU
MAFVVRSILDSYDDFMENKSDPRVKDWAMMSSPFPTVIICLIYAYSMKVIGPKLMENRKPFQLKNTLIVYNLFQVIFSTWLFYESCVSGWMNHYSLKCQPVDYSETPLAMRMARGCWWYYISKFSEFFDTLFFVLRKKNRQISTLHIIHHGVMPLSVWFGVKFSPGGHSTFFGFLNTFVHIIMYSYYLLAALGPSYQKYLWWKKYLTTIQMIQFVLVMVHAFQLLFIDCNYPKAFVWWIGGHAVMFYFLFSQFYNETYKDDRKEKKEKVKVDKTVKDCESEAEDDERRYNVGICFVGQTSLYDDGDNIKKIKKGYKASEDNNALRNRAFINTTITTSDS